MTWEDGMPSPDVEVQEDLDEYEKAQRITEVKRNLGPVFEMIGGCQGENNTLDPLYQETGQGRDTDHTAGFDGQSIEDEGPLSKRMRTEHKQELDSPNPPGLDDS